MTWGPGGASVIVRPWEETELVTLAMEPIDVARVSESGLRVLTWKSGKSPVLWTRPAEPNGNWSPRELKEVDSTTYDVRLSTEFVDGTDSLVVWSTTSSAFMHGTTLPMASFNNMLSVRPSWRGVVAGQRLQQRDFKSLIASRDGHSIFGIVLRSKSGHGDCPPARTPQESRR